ncbi:MAG: DUF4124 domain-containing protein [Pseudomonadota bacterium]
MSYPQNTMKLTILILSMFSIPAFAETVYKTVDEDGNVIFTDQPSAQAERIELQELQTIENPNPGNFRPPDKQSSSNEPSSFYQAFSIIEPAADEGYRANSGNVSIKLSLEPGLRPGHKVVIKMDGKEIASGASLSTSVSNVDRGTHTISATVVNRSGETLMSATSSFSVLRAAVGS